MGGLYNKPCVVYAGYYPTHIGGDKKYQDRLWVSGVDNNKLIQREKI